MVTDEPLDLAPIEARHPLARNGLCALHQGDNGPCEATALLAEVKRLRAQLADVWDGAFQAGKQYGYADADWWDAYDDELSADENDPAPYLPGNPYRPIANPTPEDTP